MAITAPLTTDPPSWRSRFLPGDIARSSSALPSILPASSRLRFFRASADLGETTDSDPPLSDYKRPRDTGTIFPATTLAAVEVEPNSDVSRFSIIKRAGIRINGTRAFCASPPISCVVNPAPRETSSREPRRSRMPSEAATRLIGNR